MNLTALPLTLILTIPLTLPAYSDFPEPVVENIEVVGLLGGADATGKFDGLIVVNNQATKQTHYLTLGSRVPGYESYKITRIEGKDVFVSRNSHKTFQLDWRTLTLAERRSYSRSSLRRRLYRRPPPPPRIEDSKPQKTKQRAPSPPSISNRRDRRDVIKNNSENEKRLIDSLRKLQRRNQLPDQREAPPVR